MPDKFIQSFPFSLKQLDDAGSFEGLASVYGNRDLQGDVVEAGAFKEFVFTQDQQIRILDGHNINAPIGKGTIEDRAEGLLVRGKLNLAVARAREVLALMKDRIIDGLSVGYDILEGGSAYENGTRLLKKLKLWEISLTPFPANELARVSAVKSIAECLAIADWEQVLRSHGVSKRKARKMALHDWPILTGGDDPADADELSEEMKARAVESLKAFNQFIK